MHGVQYHWYSSSSSRPVSLFRRRAHIRAVVLHTLHIGLRNTILWHYLVTFNMLACFYFRHSTLTDVAWRPPPTYLQVTSPYPLLSHSSSESSRPSPATLVCALSLNFSFAAPPDPFSSEVARHNQKHWTFTDLPPPTGSIQCLVTLIYNSLLLDLSYMDKALFFLPLILLFRGNHTRLTLLYDSIICTLLYKGEFYRLLCEAINIFLIHFTLIHECNASKKGLE